jgi:hypothetical protein
MVEASSSLLVAVMQPTFLPWLGYFDIIDQSDIFLLYDDVQFAKQSWQTRNRIVNSNNVIFVNIPVKKCNLDTSINKVLIDNTKPWKKKLLNSLYYSYCKADFFLQVWPSILDFFNRDFEFLNDFNTSFIKFISWHLGITSRFIATSDLDLPLVDNKVDRLVNLTSFLNAKIYLSTRGSYNYLLSGDAEFKFNSNNISLVFHNFMPVEYPTISKPFIPYMSILDCLFNNGFSNTLNIIRATRKPNIKITEIYESK